jgi:hypothetical protein
MKEVEALQGQVLEYAKRFGDFIDANPALKRLAGSKDLHAGIAIAVAGFLVADAMINPPEPGVLLVEVDAQGRPTLWDPPPQKTPRKARKSKKVAPKGTRSRHE